MIRTRTRRNPEYFIPRADNGPSEAVHDAMVAGFIARGAEKRAQTLTPRTITLATGSTFNTQDRSEPSAEEQAEFFGWVEVQMALDIARAHGWTPPVSK